MLVGLIGKLALEREHEVAVCGFARGRRTAAMGRVDEMVPWKSLVSLSWGPSV